jgi:hypothetical protein
MNTCASCYVNWDLLRCPNYHPSDARPYNYSSITRDSTSSVSRMRC